MNRYYCFLNSLLHPESIEKISLKGSHPDLTCLNYKTGVLLARCMC